MLELIIPLLAAATLLAVAIASLVRGDLPILKGLPAWVAPAWHFSAYVVLAFFCVRLLAGIVESPYDRFLIGWFIATGIGAVMEWLQRFSPGRTPRVADALLNAAGALVGSGIALI